MYKSKLQELCVVKSWTYPKYSPIKDGPDHNPRFRASVFVNGATFDSPTFCKSVKEAQNKAAEAALIHFISLSSARFPYSLPPGHVTSEDGFKMMETNKSILPAEAKEVTKKKPELEKQEEHKSNTSVVVRSCNFKTSQSVANLQEREIEASELDMNSLSLEKSPQDTGPKSAQGGAASESIKHPKINPAEVGSPSLKGEGKLMREKAEKSSDLKKEKDPEVSSYLLSNRIRVYSYVPEIANLPKGVTVLQVCENKWVAMSLDFPNEKGK
ncbi:hypothetical protein SOVF_066370 [Spinacia oleracea]|uniref:Double-stranded RNA-binding protein 1 n=1 Tax=Spinacia oleracea TaxID=3562 RepID=A0A9R0JJH6_SPIOL|nr:double-stranded RNA-binding protein 1-like [Spinacia oleracea]KNA18910.1 hypothetical protein SOVF_066370 [Spinacia oleracea]